MLYQLSYTHHVCGRPVERHGRSQQQTIAGAVEEPWKSHVEGRRLRDCSGQGALMAGGDPERRAVRTGRRNEDRLPVVAELLDRLADVGERAVVSGFGGGGEVDPREPSSGQFLDAGDVYIAVVQ